MVLCELGYLISTYQKFNIVELCIIRFEQLSELMLVFLTIQKKLSTKNMFFIEIDRLKINFWAIKKSKKKKVFRSFCVFFYLVFEIKIKKKFFEKLWPLKLFKRQNDTFLPKKIIKKEVKKKKKFFS